MGSSTDLDDFRRSTVAFIERALADGDACPAFGAIVPPALHDRARHWQRTMFDAGFAGIQWPERWGGRGLTHDHAQIWYEECARAGVAPYVSIHLILAGEAILRSGSDAQRARFCEPMLRADVLWCQLFSEPGAGSDLAALTASAVPDGDHFVLDGQKVWSSIAQFAEWGILLARTDPSAPRHRGISFFLLDMSLPGIDVRPLRQMSGDSEFCEVFFDSVRVPADALLGAPGDGWRIAMEVFVDERGSFGSAGAISLDRELQRLASVAGAGGPVQRDELAALIARGRSLRTLLEQSATDPRLAPVAKLTRTELGQRAAALEIAAGGAEGMLAGEAAERFLYSPGMRIAGGTSEIQRNIIGERLLGLPREPR